MKELIRRYQFEIYPSPIQKRYLEKIFGSVRFVYNEFLKINKDLWENTNLDPRLRTRLSRTEMQKYLTFWRDGLDWLKKTPSQALQVSCHDLDVAYQNFFQGRSQMPEFKKKCQRQCFQLPQPKIEKVSGQTCIFIPNFKTWVPIRQHRKLPLGMKLGAATISKTPSGKYFISVVVTFLTKEGLSSKSNDRIGVDLNIKEIVFSNGKKISPPQIIKTLEKRKRRLQKSMQRQRHQKLKEKQKECSKNYEKNRKSLAKIHERMTFQKNDFLHKLALGIYRENQAVAMETLNVKGMMKNRRLSRSIAFQCWGRFYEIMKMYASQYDKQLYSISMWFPSSKKCSSCGEVNKQLTLAMRIWNCDICGSHHDRDINAAINIKNEGGSYPVKLVERKGTIRRPRRVTMSSVKQESSRFEMRYESISSA